MFLQKILKTNSAAVQRYLESCSSDEKAQLLVDNAAAQHKHQQSLSPEDEAQILNKDAAAHRNNLSPFPQRKKPNCWIQMLPHKKIL
jgi:hypothetical protein